MLLSLEKVTSDPQVRLSRETMMQLMTSLVTSHHIIYCNSMMVRLTPSIIYLVSSPTGPECSRSADSWPQSTIPHHSCSTTTPLVTSEIPDHLKSRYAHAQHCPPLCHSYLSNLVTFCSSDPHHRQLRSSTVRSAVVSQFGRRTFTVCGPDI